MALLMLAGCQNERKDRLHEHSIGLCSTEFVYYCTSVIVEQKDMQIQCHIPDIVND